ncbi:MAG: site-2 protease family protein [Anaerolineales bacterium]|nr:site-2 protease family protein [Anaerolineales bacterium]
MGNNIRIGKIFGIKIKINWSWLFILVLVTWNLTNLFGSLHPEWTIQKRFLTAFSAAILFFASVLAHELAHSLMARARGVPVQGITLFLFGGVSSIQRHPDSPLSEFLITIVGPATSIILGIFFIAVSGVGFQELDLQVENASDIISQLKPLPTLLLWLGPINLLLGVFNMIPGFPLDGGRVLRSILWSITEDLRKATRWASWVGQTIAWLMIMGGISMVFGAKIPFFGSGLIDGLWLSFIGWFLNSAAVQSYQEIVVQDILEGVKVEDMMRVDPPTVNGKLSVSELVDKHIMQKDDHAFPVLEENHLVGLVTLEDVRGVNKENWEDVLVNEIMTPRDELVTVTKDEDASDAFTKLSRKSVRQLPVCEGDEIVGFLRREEIVKWLKIHANSVMGNMMSISASMNRGFPDLEGEQYKERN